MTQNGKVAAGAAVVLILVLGTGYLLMHGGVPGGSMQEAAASASNSGLLPLPSGMATTDAALTQDTTTIDAQMNKLHSESALMDQGVNAQQVP